MCTRTLELPEVKAPAARPMPAISALDGPVAVTGVSGYTGGHMVRELVHHGYTVRACLRDATSWRGQDAISYLSKLPGVEIHAGCDLFIPGSYDAAFKGCVGVFHVAAVLGNSTTNQPNASGDGGKDTYDGGIRGTQNVIDAIDRAGTVKRLVYTSSMAAVQNGTKGPDHEWTETDWSSDGHDVESPAWQKNWYGRSKVDTEHLVNAAAAASGGKWDAITMNPAMITGPILFKAQNGQWIEQIGRLAGGLGPNWPSPNDMYYDLIDVRDLCSGHRLAMESPIDHLNSHGGPRYIMHGSGGYNNGHKIRFGTELADVIRHYFPGVKVGSAKMARSDGTPFDLPPPTQLYDSKKAKKLLGVTLRPAEETIRDCVESSIELGLIKVQLQGKL